MILIGADFVPTTSNLELFRTGDKKTLFGTSLCDLLDRADYRIFNLEIPLCDTEHPINKCGKNFIAPTNSVGGYVAARADLLTLANNHILDQGEQGLESTMRILQDNDIHFTGAGNTTEEAAAPFFFECMGKTIGVYACAEHEFSIVTPEHAGANPFDALETPDRIAEAKKRCDYLIVLYHGGKEHYRYPSPLLQKTCRKLVEKGADLVVCQHSHCIGCEEKYMDGTIIYGQGNFLFDNSSREHWQTGLLIGIDASLQVQYYPLAKHGNGVRLAEGEKAEAILSDFSSRSREITREGFVERSFAQFADDSLTSYLMAINGKKSAVFRALNKLTGYRLNGLVLRRYGRAERTALKNYLECEAIREMLIAGIDRRDRNGE